MRYKAVARWFGVTATWISSFLLCAVSARPLAAADDGVALPRYRLAVGQELVYQLTSQEDPRESNDAKNEKGNTARNQMEWRIVVARQNDDGSWRLYIRTKITLANRDGTVRGKRDSLDYCDLHPDGSYSLDERTAISKRLGPYQLFCRLPATTAALANGWNYEVPVQRELFTYRLVKRDGAHLHIAGIQSGVYGDVNSWQMTKTYDFDAERGLVVGIANEWKDLAPEQVKSRTTFRLISSTHRDPAWVARFHVEAQKYLDVYAKWMTACYEGEQARSVEVFKTARERARTLLVAGRQQAELATVRTLYDADIQAHDNDEEEMIRFMKTREELFAKVPGFSTTWEAKNFDGSLFRLADQRGKVVVLYFWTRYCQLNILAAPQICQVAADYQGKKDVALVGMFIRGEAADDQTKAKYIIAKCLRSFPQLEAKDIAALYSFQHYGLGCPTTLVLDQVGRVHDVYVGYVGDLGERIRKSVDELRTRPPAKKD